MEQYRMSIAHYPLHSNTANYQAFTIGRVRFIISDLRSEADGRQLCSEEQEEWLLNELSKSSDYDFVIWVTPVPWIGDETDIYTDKPQDNWFGFPGQRARVSDFISSLEKKNVFALSGDAHMLALDDGSNTYYGRNSTTTLSFPILQSGPLDQVVSHKGGPFSNGCYATQWERSHQYSVIDYSILGNTPCLTVTAYEHKGLFGTENKAFVESFCGENIFKPRGATPSDDCKNQPLFSTRTWMRVTATALLAALAVGLILFTKILQTWTSRTIMSIYFLCLLGLVYFAGGFPYFLDQIKHFDALSVSFVGLLAVISVDSYLLGWIYNIRRKKAISPVTISRNDDAAQNGSDNNGSTGNRTPSTEEEIIPPISEETSNTSNRQSTCSQELQQ
jgi:hypothetical protein